MSRVLLVNMPFSNLRWPNLGISLLKAALARRGIGCDLAYLNYDFAERVGLEAYCWIADCFAFVLGGERLFAKHYFGQAIPEDARYFRDVLLPADPGLSDVDRRDFEAVARQVEPFLDDCEATIDWARYAIVGFAASFQQTMPSMCLARRIKQRRPDVRILLGGAACEGPMGVELLRQFTQLDYVFLGEADLTLGPVVGQILAGKAVDLPPGVMGRESLAPGEKGGREAELPPDPAVALVGNLDELPYPDFDDYFMRWQASPLRGQIDPLLFFETSRGCWWGQKHHCLFCGLNGSSLTFRSKSPQRAVDELRHLVERHRVRRACAADNILDYRYFGSFLPQLRAAGLGLTFEYEMKANLTRAQVGALVASGLGAAQLGIETFVTALLRRMGKGANGLQNLQALKWFSEAGIEVKWNLLYGFPGEEPADYAWLAWLLPALCHLAPPLAVGRVRMDRFAPYFDAPQAHGMVNPRPNRAFCYVCPFDRAALERMAYYYEFDFADGRNPLDYAQAALDAAEAWQQIGGAVTLRYWDRPDGVLILHDTRPAATVFQRRLTGLERRIYLACDAGRSLRQILQIAAEHAVAGVANQPLIQRTLREWIDQRIMAFLDGRYLSLALRTPGAEDHADHLPGLAGDGAGE